VNELFLADENFWFGLVAGAAILVVIQLFGWLRIGKKKG